jgi:hypothetical protein
MQMRLTDARAMQGDGPGLRDAGGARLLVVLSRRAARVYACELRNSAPQRLIPYDRNGFGRHLHRAEDYEATGLGTRRHEQFAGAVADTLRGAGSLLLLGSGPGGRAAVGTLFSVLRRQHQDLADRVVGSIVVAADHLTEDALLAATRAFYAGASRAPEQSRWNEPHPAHRNGEAYEDQTRLQQARPAHVQAVHEPAGRAFGPGLGRCGACLFDDGFAPHG